MPLAFILTPASLTHSALFAGYYTYLGTQVAWSRRTGRVALGNYVEPSATEPKSTAVCSKKEQARRYLPRATRAFNDFAFSTPFSLFVTTIAELNGAPTFLVHGAYSLLLISKIISSQFTLLSPEDHQATEREKSLIIAIRGASNSVAQTVTLAAASYNFYLGWEALKSFLGIRE